MSAGLLYAPPLEPALTPVKLGRPLFLFRGRHLKSSEAMNTALYLPGATTLITQLNRRYYSLLR